MKQWIDGKIVEMSEDDEIVDKVVEPEIDPMTEVQLALTEIYEMILGGGNNG